MSDEPEPYCVKAMIGWADFGVRCPACGHLNTTGDDWSEDALDGPWQPGAEHRFMLCEGEGCDLLLELPDVTLTQTFSEEAA